jgi:hypothetical protein
MSADDPTNPTPRPGRKPRRPWKPAFVAAIRRGASVCEACQAANVNRPYVYEARARDPAFRAAWAAAEEDAVDEVESLLLDRIRHGTPREVFYRGEQCGVIHEYSDALLLAFLRARRPERWHLGIIDEEKLVELARRVREDRGRAPGNTEDSGPTPGSTAGPPVSHPA